MRTMTMLAILLSTLFQFAHGADGSAIRSPATSKSGASTEKPASIKLASVDQRTSATAAASKDSANPANETPWTSGENSPAKATETPVPGNTLSRILSNFRSELPDLRDISVLPVIKRVYPTGAKPLVILSFKCPSEILGIAPPPTRMLHEMVNLGAHGINSSNLLSFDLQQVCS